MVESGVSVNGTVVTDREDFDNAYYLGILGVFGLGQALLSFLRNWFFFSTCANGSMVIHNKLFDVIMRAR